tara:strand:+ start:409 stop:975 length:567 start_codon:yes stop_codon:yes gene_type:complete
MNCFRHSYLIVHLDDDFFPQLEKAIEKYDDYERCKTEQWDGKKYNSEDHPDRESKSCWIDDDAVYPMVDGLVRFANSKAEWNFDIDFIEPLQNTLYDKGDFYDWHIDESNWSPGKRQNGRVRKISFTVLLNDEFEGGEFEIFTNEKHVVELKKKDIILFHADTPHRVREVTSGVRKSLVGWTQGPAYK